MSKANNEIQAFRGEMLHFTADPAVVGEADCYEYFSDGLLVVEQGLIKGFGDARRLLPSLPDDITVAHHENGLLVPGFIDTHIHYPQTEMIASFGEQLLGWLENYAFPTERKFSDASHGAKISEFFLDELLKNGTTTAMVFGTVHSESVEAFFLSAKRKNLRMICGKVLMDRNAPDYLLDTAATGYADSRALIEKWHGNDRLAYAVTPRFAPTSTDEQLRNAAKLLNEYPGVYMQTHLSENLDEMAWVKELYPESKNYLDVYDSFGLLGPRSLFAHGIHLSDEECVCLADKQSAVSFCPTSNLFIGSGLYNLKQAEDAGYKVGFGTDVGGGTSFSMLQTMSEAYKVQQLRGHTLGILKSFYLATLGGAHALDLQDSIGNFAAGKEADFIILDYEATPLIKLRLDQCTHLNEKLFVLAMLGDDRAVRDTFILGQKVGVQS